MQQARSVVLVISLLLATATLAYSRVSRITTADPLPIRDQWISRRIFLYAHRISQMGVQADVVVKIRECPKDLQGPAEIQTDNYATDFARGRSERE